MTKTEFLTKAELMQSEITTLDAELKRKIAEYKAFTREHIGIADGDTTNVLDIYRAIRKVSELG
jgi:hypothetical protein